MVSLKTKDTIAFHADDVIDRFNNYLIRNLKENLQEIILFGSRARGDFREDSDYDFAILVNSTNKKIIRDIVLDAEVMVLDEFNKMATSQIYTMEEWEKKKKYPIGKNIISDGIAIWMRQEK